MYPRILKMESVSKNIIFGLKMMVKSGLEKFEKVVIFVTEFVILCNGQNLEIIYFL